MPVSVSRRGQRDEYLPSKFVAGVEANFDPLPLGNTQATLVTDYQDYQLTASHAVTKLLLKAPAVPSLTIDQLNANVASIWTSGFNHLYLRQCNTEIDRFSIVVGRSI